MKKELKIRRISNNGNSYLVECVLNEGYFETQTDEVTGESYEAFIRTKIKEFDVFRDVVPEDVEEVIIEVLCLENNWLRSDFVN